MGGNAFKDVTPFEQSLTQELTNKLNKILQQTNVKVIPIGSTATPTVGKTSNDLDLIVEERTLSRYFDEKNPKKIRDCLEKLFKESGYVTGRSGVSVHVRVPYKDAFHQADIMVVPNAETVSKYHIHNLPAGSPYKGVHKHLALMYLAKKQNLLWSAFSGLYNRNSEGKRNHLIADTLDDIAYVLLGVNSTASSLDSLEAIMYSMTTEDASEMLSALRQDPSWKEPQCDTTKYVSH